jgi:hypothetical protein
MYSKYTLRSLNVNRIPILSCMNRTNNSKINLILFHHVLTIIHIYFKLVEVLLKLRCEDDPTFKVDFHVDFSSIEYVAKDVFYKL